MTRPSVTALAKALGVHERTVQRWRRAGLTPPAGDENLDAWAARARAWAATARRRSGPTVLPGIASAKVDADTALARLRAQKLQLELRLLRGDVHSRHHCDALFVRSCAELRAAFARLPGEFAQKLYQAPSPEAIQVIVEEEIRRCFEVLTAPDEGDADSAALA